MERGRLRIGDLILLKLSKVNEGYLSADGIIDIDCHLSPSATLENSLWQVIVQNQYSAATELEHALYLLQIEHPNLDDLTPLIEKDSRLLQLSRTAQNEKRLNKKLMKMKAGKAVSFGDVIQLLHVKSQKILSVSPWMLAKHERENLRAYLKEDGDSMSWFELMPRYKYDKEGQPVANGNECLIRVHEKSSDYIHASKKSFHSSMGDRSEINCSLESSVWTISIYQSANNIKSGTLLCGNLVTLHEPETSTYLQVKQESILSPESLISQVVMSESVHLSLTSQTIDNVGTQFLWQIESVDMLSGGILHNSVGKFVFKNINTDLYLKLDTRGISATRDRNDCTHFEISVPYQMGYGEVIVDGTLSQLTTNGRTIGFCKTSSGVFELGSCLLSDRMTLSFQISSKLHSLLSYQIFVGREAVTVLRQFYTHFLDTFEILTTQHSVNTFSINLISDPYLLKLFGQIELNIKDIIVCLDYLKSYLQCTDAGYSALDEDMGEKKSSISEISMDSKNIKGVLGNQKDKVTLIRQTMMREQGVLDVLLAIIDLLGNQDEDVHLTYVGLLRHSYTASGPLNRQHPETIMRKKSSKTLNAARTKLSEEVATIDKDLSRLCLHILFLAINKNQLNQMYVADRFTVLLNQVKYQEYAVTCVREMLRDNRQMLQTKVCCILSIIIKLDYRSRNCEISRIVERKSDECNFAQIITCRTDLLLIYLT